MFNNVIDELFTNAVYNAPIHEEKDSRLQERSSLIELKYAGDKEGYFKFAYNDNYIFVECCDPYGSLNAKKLVLWFRV